MFWREGLTVITARDPPRLQQLLVGSCGYVKECRMLVMGRPKWGVCRYSASRYSGPCRLPVFILRMTLLGPDTDFTSCRLSREKGSRD